MIQKLNNLNSTVNSNMIKIILSFIASMQSQLTIMIKQTKIILTLNLNFHNARNNKVVQGVINHYDYVK